MKPLILSFLFILLSSSLWVYVINNDVNLRKGPDNKKRVLTTVPKGEEITLLEKTNQWWWQVEYKGKKGYIAATFIEVSYPKTLLNILLAYPYLSATLSLVIMILILLAIRKRKPSKTRKIVKR
jgi:uncharacterized protein YraI